jgi:uncharacterized membrane protein affecting hemolysin expression
MIAILLLVAVVLLMMALIQLRKRKWYTTENQPQNPITYDACPNPAYGGKFYVEYYD